MALRKIYVTLNGIRTPVEFEWNEATSQGNAEITINAPLETSWNKEGHYYPISIELEGSGGYMGEGEILNTEYNPNTEYGEKLRLFVKEEVAPTITILQPLDKYYVSVRDNTIRFLIEDEEHGSRIDYSTLKVIASGDDITDSVEYKEIENGYSCKAKIPDKPMGVYNLYIEVKDFDGNGTSQEIEYEYIVLITDRTLADVIYARENQETTENLKGAYNISDLIRVEKAVEYMTRRLHTVGYTIRPITYLGWKRDEIILKDTMQRYLDNVHTIKNVLPTNSPLPGTMSNFTHDGANEIEQAIIDTDNMINTITKAQYYCAELYGGEI